MTDIPRRTVADVYVTSGGEATCIPVGSTDEHPLAALITNPQAWDGGAAPSKAKTTPPDGTLPPKSGAGSGKDAWAAYAAAKGVTVAGEASRDDIIAACAAAGVPTEATPSQ